MPLPWTWIPRDSGAPAGTSLAYYGCYALGKFWVPLSNGAGIAVSEDGITWTTVNVGQGANAVWRVKFVNGALYALFGAGGASRSTDGETWVACTTGTSVQITDIAFDGTRYIYCGFSGVIRYSTNNLLSSSSPGSGTNTSDTYYSIEVASGLYRIAGQNNASPAYLVMMTSSSGTAWTRAFSPSGSPLQFVRKIGDFWFRGGIEFNSSTLPKLWRSSDGVSWVAVSLPVEFVGAAYDMIYTNGMYIVVGMNNSAAYSYDGDAFLPLDPGFDPAAPIRSVFEGEQTVVMAGGSNTTGGAAIRTAFIEPQRFFGTVRDKTGALVSRKVLAIREATDVVVHAAMSDPTTGAYQLETPYYEPHTLVFDGEPDRNALVFSGVMPG